jgi:hypothetical protein
MTHTTDEHKGAIEVSIIFHEGQQMFAVPKQPAPAQPVAWANPKDLKNFDMKVRTNGGPLHTVALCLCTPPAAQPAPAQKPVARTDQQIVDQTEELAVWLLLWRYNRQPETDTGGAQMRESTHPFAERCWTAACHIQEMLTATDPENAVAELEATNRQVEILSDALAESRREVAALKAVQEPWGYGRMSWGEKMFLPTLPSVRDGGWMALYTAPPAAQPAPVQEPVNKEKL